MSDIRKKILWNLAPLEALNFENLKISVLFLGLCLIQKIKTLKILKLNISKKYKYSLYLLLTFFIWVNSINFKIRDSIFCQKIIHFCLNLVNW